MKKSTKIILGTTIPVVALAAIIPTVVVLTKPQPEGEFELDVSEVEKHATSYIERKYDVDGYCYLTGIKFISGNVSTLKARLINVKDFDTTKYDAEVIQLEDNYLMVKIHFESDYMIGIKSPTFDVEIYNNTASTTITGCSAAFTENSIYLTQGSLKSEQVFYTKEIVHQRSLFLRGNLKGTVRTLTGSRSIVDWSTFDIKCNILTPIIGLRMNASFYQLGVSPFIKLDIIDCPSSLSAIPIKLIITNSYLPNWEYDFDLTLTLEQKETNEDLFAYKIIEGTTNVAIDDTYTIDEDVTIPDKVTIDGTEYTVTTINGSAFSYYLNLKKVTLPDTLTTIGKDAFLNCRNLNDVTIPSSVTSIDPLAFEMCYGLTNFAVDDENANYSSKIGGSQANCLLDKVGTKLIAGLNLNNIPSGVTSLGKDCFASSATLTDVTITSDITSLEEDAFEYSSIKRITFADDSSITEIPGSLCYSCESLEEVNFNENITKVGIRGFSKCPSIKVLDTKNITTCENWAFEGLTSLETLNIGKSLADINSKTFENCTGLKNIVVSSDNTHFTSLGADGKECGALLSKDKTKVWKGSSSFTGLFETNVKVMDAAFEGISNIKTLNIPSTLTSIGVVAFANCSDLEAINFGSNPALTNVSDAAFRGCSKITELTIPKTVKSISPSAFASCSSLTKVTYASDSPITTLSARTFDSCASLTQITLPTNLSVIDNWAFSECYALEKITLPQTLTSIGNGAFTWCTSLNNISIPDTVTNIGNSAFAYDTSLTKATITNDSTLASLGMGAFMHCVSLDNILIPKGVTVLNSNTFENCYSLKTITLPNTLTSLGVSCFQKCVTLPKISLPDTITEIKHDCFNGCFKLKSVNIPNTITTINEYVFYECVELTSISIPSSVTSILYGAFSYCDKLDSATFGTTSGWKYLDETDVGISTNASNNAVILRDGHVITTLL